MARHFQWSNVRGSTQKDSCLACKYQNTVVSGTDIYKHSWLLCNGFNYGLKKFYNIGCYLMNRELGNIAYLTPIKNSFTSKLIELVLYNFCNENYKMKQIQFIGPQISKFVGPQISKFVRPRYLSLLDHRYLILLDHRYLSLLDHRYLSLLDRRCLSLLDQHIGQGVAAQWSNS